MVNVREVRKSLKSIDRVDSIGAYPRGKRNNGPVRFGIDDVTLDSSKVDNVLEYDFTIIHNREGFDTIIDIYKSFGRLENYKGDVFDVVVDEGDFILCEVSKGSSAIKGALVRINKDSIDENNYKFIDL